MKKVIVTSILTTVLFSSYNANAQFGSLIKKKDKGATSGASSGGKEQLIEDEPGTIFGNYYFKFLPHANANEAIVESAKGKLPEEGKTIQIKRWEAGKSDKVIFAWNGESKSAYTWENNICGDCEKTNNAGLVRYGYFSYFIEPGKAEVKVPGFLKWMLVDFHDGVLNCGYLVLSKDKEKLKDYTAESLQAKTLLENQKYNEFVKSIDKGSKLPDRVAYVKNAAYDKARQAAPAALKKHLAEKGITHLEPLYAYETTKDQLYTSIKDPLTQREVARQILFVVVCKNNSIADSNIPALNKYKTKYVAFQYTAVREDGSGQSFAGNFYVNSVTPGIAIADTENAMMYK